MGAFAFSCSFSPGSSDDRMFINEVVIPLLGDAGAILKPQLRRLFFEAYTLAALDVQRRVAPSDEPECPKKLPAPERLSCLRAIKARLEGLAVEEQLEPSDALIDKFNAMREEGRLHFLAWDELTRRGDEVKSVKQIKALQADSEGKLKASEETKEDPADTGRDLKLKSAFQRRGIAMEVTQLVSFQVHAGYINWLFREMSRKAPSGSHYVNTQQIHQVDSEVFLRLAERTREGLDILGNGRYVLADLLISMMADPTIHMS